jgi:hypothetical protein
MSSIIQLTMLAPQSPIHSKWNNPGGFGHHTTEQTTKQKRRQTPDSNLHSIDKKLRKRYITSRE